MPIKIGRQFPILLGMAAALTLPTAAAATCLSWNLEGERLIQPGQIKFHEDQPARFIAVQLKQEGAKLTGLATVTWFEQGDTAKLSGAISGDKLTMRADWPTQGRGIVEYSGTIQSDGNVAGTAKSWSSPSETWLWSFRQPATCALPSSATVRDAQAPVSSFRPVSPRSSQVSETPPIDMRGSAGTAAMNGRFRSSFGTLVLGNQSGSYDYKDGQVTISRIMGNVMEGTWEQRESGQRCPDGRYRGRFRFSFSETGFSGQFGYCDGPATAGQWNGTRE